MENSDYIRKERCDNRADLPDIREEVLKTPKERRAARLEENEM